MTWHAIDAPEGARDGTIVPVEAGGERIALVRAGGRWYAVEDACTHSDCAFSEYGELFDELSLCCNCHGAEFHLGTGEVLADPATEDVRVFPVEERDGRICVEVVTAP